MSTGKKIAIAALVVVAVCVTVAFMFKPQLSTDAIGKRVNTVFERHEVLATGQMLEYEVEGRELRGLFTFRIDTLDDAEFSSFVEQMEHALGKCDVREIVQRDVIGNMGITVVDQELTHIQVELQGGEQVDVVLMQEYAVYEYTLVCLPNEITQAMWNPDTRSLWERIVDSF